MFRRLFYVLSILCVPFLIFSEQDVLQKEDLPSKAAASVDDVVKKLRALDWKFDGTHKLPQSQSSIALPKDYMMLAADDAKKEIELVEGFYDKDRDSNVDAVVYDGTEASRIVFNYVDSGYVTSDDWKEVDPRAFLNSMSEGAKEDNARRKELGIPQVLKKLR